jgi:hypothetical protein
MLGGVKGNPKTVLMGTVWQSDERAFQAKQFRFVNT